MQNVIFVSDALLPAHRFCCRGTSFAAISRQLFCNLSKPVCCQKADFVVYAIVVQVQFHYTGNNVHSISECKCQNYFQFFGMAISDCRYMYRYIFRHLVLSYKTNKAAVMANQVTGTYSLYMLAAVNVLERRISMWASLIAGMKQDD